MSHTPTFNRADAEAARAAFKGLKGVLARLADQSGGVFSPWAQIKRVAEALDWACANAPPPHTDGRAYHDLCAFAGRVISVEDDLANEHNPLCHALQRGPAGERPPCNCGVDTKILADG